MTIPETKRSWIVDDIKAKISQGTIIPKPRGEVIVKGWGKRRGESALIYKIPNNKNPNKHNEKGITESEWDIAYNQLKETGALTRQWFNETLQDCKDEGSCNFTTIGGVFVKIGLAEYKGPGLYEII